MSESIHDLQPGEAMLVDWTAAQYHADRECESRSRLMDMRASPSLYYVKHVARTLYTPETAAMLLGTYTHLAVLEPDEWARRLYPPDPVRPYGADGRAKKDTLAKQLYLDWKSDLDVWEKAQAADSIIVGADDRENITRMAAAVRGHEAAREALDAPGENEQTIVWRHPTGILIRVRLDRLDDPNPETKVVIDLKTTAALGPTAFGRSATNLGYHRQAAIYTDAVQALYPDAEVYYVLIVVRSAPPYEVAVYELCEGELALGRVQYEHWIDELVRRRADDDWLADWQVGINPLELPEWAYREKT